MKPTASLRHFLCIASSALLAIPSAHAASGNWNVNNSGDWSTASNWSSNPTVPGTVAGDTIGFANDINLARTVTIDSNIDRIAGILNIGDSNNTHGFTIDRTGTGILTLDNGGSAAQINETGSVNDTISAPITLASNLAASVLGSLTLSGDIGQSGGAKTLTKTGAGTLTLSGSNSYSGATTISSGGGSIILSNLNAIANSTSVSVASGTSLRFAVGGTYATAGPISIAGTGLAGLANPGALYFSADFAHSVLNAPINLTAAATISSFGASMTTTLGGAIGGTGPLTIASQGGAIGHFATWTLGAASNYTGNTIFTNTGGDNDATVKLGINDALPTTTSLNLQASNSVNVATFQTFDLNGRNQTLAGLTDTGGAKSGGSSTAGKRVINSSGTLSTLTLNIASGTNTYGTTGTNITRGTIGGTTAAGVAADNLALTKTGAGTLALAGNNTYTGATTVSQGTLSITGGYLSASTTINIASGAFLTTSVNNTFSGGGSGQGAAWTIAGTITGTANGQTMPASVTLNNGTVSGTFKADFGTFLSAGGSGTTITANGATNTVNAGNIGMASALTVNTPLAGDALAISSQLGATSVLGGALTKNGLGTLTLSGINTYTGATNVNGGTLTLGHATNTLVNTGAVNVNGGTLALGTNTDTVGAVTLTSGSITGTGAGALTGTGSAYDVRSGSISAKLGGTVGLTKTTGGTVTISSDNSVGGYTGATSVNGGKLTIASTGTINTTSGVSIGAGEFNYNSSTALSQPVSFSGTGGTLSGSGTITPAVNVTTGNTLAIGNSVGVMNFGGNLTVGGTYLFELDNTLNTADLADVAGNLALGGILDLVQLGAYAAGDKFTLFAYDGTLSGLLKDFGGVTNILDDTTFTDAGGIWTMNYNDTTAGLNGGVSANSTYVTITAVPEPGAALIGSLGLLALLRRRRN